jgi:cytochrome c oxidase subunit II
MPPPSATTPLQSVLVAAGPEAAEVVTLIWWMVAGAAVVGIAVLVLLWLALRGGPYAPRWLCDRQLLVAGGIVAPTLVLGALLIFALRHPARLWVAEDQAVLRVDVVGEQWWWRLRYLDASGAVLFETANELVLPVDLPVTLTLTSADVLHSFWVPALAGKLDVVPGRVNRLTLRADRAGDFRGQCAEYCGGSHAWMALWVRARSTAEYDTWLLAQRQIAAADLGHRGAAVFLARCAHCHTVRGTAAAGGRGPDLTHLASRGTLAAGRLANGAAGRARWLIDSQHLKPGNGMPGYGAADLDDADRTALLAWLDQLR